MNVQSINNNIKTKQWMKTIKECRESGLQLRRGVNRIMFVNRPTTNGLKD